MDESRLYPKYRYVMGVLNFLIAAFTHSIFIVFNPLLNVLVRDFGITPATAGYASSVHIFSMGVCLLLGSVIIAKIDVRRTQLLGLIIEAAGTLLSFFVPTFPLLLACSFITGAGHGLSGSCTNTIVAAWFPKKERSMVVTINALGNAGIIALVYSTTVPLYHLFGDSWRKVMLFYGAIMAVLVVLWIIFARDNTVLNDHIKAENLKAGRTTSALSGLKEAFSRKDVIFLCLFMGIATISYQGIGTYMPQFLANVRGFSEERAAAMVGISSGFSALATFAGGSLTTIIGRRKGIILLCFSISLISATVSLLSAVPALITSMFVCYTLANNFRTPASQVVATELPHGSPALTSTAAALSFGLGFIGTPLTAPMLAFATKVFGEEYSMLVFLPLMLIAMLFVVLMPETGPKAKKRAAE